MFAVGAIGQLGHSVVFVTMAIFTAGFCMVGGQIAANALAATFYPTSIRATGVGWALGIGRVGSIIGPLLVGQFASVVPVQQLYAWTALPFAVGAVLCFVIYRLNEARLRERPLLREGAAAQSAPAE